MGELILRTAFAVLEVVIDEGLALLGHAFFGMIAGLVFGGIVIVVAWRTTRRKRLLDIGSPYDMWLRRGTVVSWFLIALPSFSLAGFFVGVSFAGEYIVVEIGSRVFNLDRSDNLASEAFDKLLESAPGVTRDFAPDTAPSCVPIPARSKTGDTRRTDSQRCCSGPSACPAGGRRGFANPNNDVIRRRGRREGGGPRQRIGGAPDCQGDCVRADV